MKECNVGSRECELTKSLILVAGVPTAIPFADAAAIFSAGSGS